MVPGCIRAGPSTITRNGCERYQKACQEEIVEPGLGDTKELSWVEPDPIT